MSGEPICKVAPTTEELANQLHAMLTSPNGIMYPNPVNDAVVKHKEKFPFIESKSVLVILESDAGATPEMFLEKVLNKLKTQVQGYHQEVTPVPLRWLERG